MALKALTIKCFPFLFLYYKFADAGQFMVILIGKQMFTFLLYGIRIKKSKKFLKYY